MSVHDLDKVKKYVNFAVNLVKKKFIIAECELKKLTLSNFDKKMSNISGIRHMLSSG